VPANKLCLAGHTSLQDLIALIAECEFFSPTIPARCILPMRSAHRLSPSLGQPPELTGPVGEGHRVVRRRLDCAPCFERRCKKGHMKCMDTISADDVWTRLPR
jgi:ADP-heptose:LPS heptosyltransferase